MSKVLDFNDNQKSLLKHVIDDMGGPTTTVVLLDTIDKILNEACPDWEVDPQALPSELRETVEVCIAALEHNDVLNLCNHK